MIPLFKSQYSLGRSILTLNKPEEEYDPEGPDSVFQILHDNNCEDLFLVEDGMSGSMEAILNSQELGIALTYGVRITAVRDVNEKGPDSKKSEHKVILFAKNNNGYKELIKIFTKAATEFEDGYPRVDFNFLKDSWSKDLTLGIPFYDSFVFNNLMTTNICVASFFGDTVVFHEDNDLPFDGYIKSAAEGMANSNGLEFLKSKSIYYKRREDYKAWVTFKCMNRKSYGSGNTLESPGLDHCSSNEFCWESYLENK